MFDIETKEKVNNKESKRSKELELFLKKRKKSNQNLNFILWIVTFFVVFLLIESFSSNNLFNSSQEKPLNEFLKNAREGKVLNVNVQGDIVRVKEVEGQEYIFRKEAGLSLDQIFKNNEISSDLIKGEVKVESVVPWGQVLLTLLSIIIPIAFLYWIFGRSKGGASDVFSFGKSRAKLFFKGSQSVTFNDVAGNKEAKTNLQEIVDFLKYPDKYRKLGARIPKGVLLVGQSGVGKTLLAKAIAGEANVPFFSVAGSEFMEMLVGVGSSRARDLFKMAREQQPSLIFIDEIDAIGRQRGMGIGGGHDEREQTLNQILIEMDGFDERTNVIVLAATNRPDMLDPALVRPGRFDRKINIPLPDFEDRKGIIQIHMRNKPFTDEVDIDDISRKTVGFSGADIENMLNEAAILAARENRDKITPKDLDNASLKVTMGEERRTLMTDDEKKITA